MAAIDFVFITGYNTLFIIYWNAQWIVIERMWSNIDSKQKLPQVEESADWPTKAWDKVREKNLQKELISRFIKIMFVLQLVSI